MALTPREQQLLNLIRESPLSTPADLARRLGSTRAAVNVHVSSLVRKGALLGRGYMLPAEQGARVVVVGGANMDFKARTERAAVPGTSNPGRTRQSVGGVGRNVAENLARLGVPVSLLSVVGRDPLGDLLLRETEGVGVDVRGVLRSQSHGTGTYTAVLDASGELLLAVADMQAMAELTPAALQERRAALTGAAWVVADGNLGADTLLHLHRLAAQAGIKVTFEPVSVPKAAHLLPVLAAASQEKGLAPTLVTPNLAELEVLTGQSIPDEQQAIAKAAARLHAQGVELVWVRRGQRGSLLCTPEQVVVCPALKAEVRDVTGAGDAMLAAFLSALLGGETPAEAAALAHAVAALTVESPYTVCPELSLDAVRKRAEVDDG